VKGRTFRRCACKDAATGRPLNQRCPDLTKRRHGTWAYSVRLDTSAKEGRQLQRAGYATEKEARAALDHVGELVRLAGDDARLRRRIGDLIFDRSKRGGQLPDAEEIRRRLGAGGDVDAPSITVREWLEDWLAGKRRLKESVRRGYRLHLDHYLLPLLGDIRLDRLGVDHISGMFDTIEEWNAEILAAHEEGRAPRLPDDVRARKKHVGIATQHRIRATLRGALNVALRRPGMLTWNPCLAVELPPERRDPARVWSPEQVGRFLDFADVDRLGVLYRVILLRGLRRGEACGLRWSDLDLAAGHATIAQTVLQIGGRIVFDTPKTRAGERKLSLSRDITARLTAARKVRARERLAAGPAWRDHDLVFCREDGRPLAPDRVSAHFRELAAAAGVPVIKLHEGRHTAATLGLESGLDVKVVSDQLGHSTKRITEDLYQHVRMAVHDEAAERVVSLIAGVQRRATGS
jgi:integrase